MKSGQLRQPPTSCLIYDGTCRMCVAIKTHLENQELQQPLRFVPYQTEEAAQFLGTKYQQGIPKAAYRVDQDGTISQGLDAFVPYLINIRWGKVLLFLWRIPVLRPLAYGVYAIIAKYRYRWFGAVPLHSDSEGGRVDGS